MVSQIAIQLCGSPCRIVDSPKRIGRQCRKIVWQWFLGEQSKGGEEQLK